MKWLPLILKNTRRHRRRTLLTIGGVVVAIFVCTVVFVVIDTINRTVEKGGSEVLLWVVDRYQAQHALSKIPASYVAQIKAIPGVQVVSPVLFWMSRYRTEQDLILIMGVDPATIRDARPYDVAEDVWQAFAREKTAALVGGDLARQYGLKVGDTVLLRGMAGGDNLSFTVRAITEERRDNPQFRDPHGRFTVHLDYLQQAVGRQGIVTNIWVKVDRPSAAPQAAAAIDALFDNYPVQTRTQSYKGFMLAMVRQMESIQLALYLLSLAIVLAILLGTANSIAMSVRERTVEVGVLKSLGFLQRHILTLVLGEAVGMALVGGLLGIALSYGVLALFGLRLPLEFSTVRGELVWGWAAVAKACAAAAGIGLLGGVWPALRAARLRVVEAVREV